MTVQAQPVMPEDATAPVAIADTHATTEAAHGGEHESGGLPQFEFQHWFGQIVYLIFLFAILYWLIAKVFAPRMRRVFDERSSTIATAVETARQVQAEAAGQAEAQATAEVRTAAADLAARAAEQILAARLAGQKSDPLLDAAIAQIGTRLN